MYAIRSYYGEDDTYAFKMYKDDIPQEVKEARAAELMEMQQEISARYSQQQIGKKLRVLVDREEEDYFVARTEFDSRITSYNVCYTKLLRGLRTINKNGLNASLKSAKEKGLIKTV